MAEQGIYWIQKIDDKSVRLLRMWGETSHAMVPEKIGDRTVKEIGNYCFAANRLPSLDTDQVSVIVRKAAPEEVTSGPVMSDSRWEEPMRETENLLQETEKLAAEIGLTEQAGTYLHAVTLPDSVKKIGTCGFYRCANLEKISLPGNVWEWGSDVFMNCVRLRYVEYRCQTEEPGCLKALLSQISWDVTVSFGREKETREAVVFYPEYTEGYDEIGPAHIFEIYIRGEGYRARQSIREGQIYFPGYDGIFAQAVVEESARTVSRMAWYRLTYPAGLQPKYEKQYETYLQTHQKKQVELLTEKEGLSENVKEAVLEALIRRKCLEQEAVEDLIRWAAKESQAALSVKLMEWKQQYIPQQTTNRYAFDDWE
jgi:hypothetical protein